MKKSVYIIGLIILCFGGCQNDLETYDNTLFLKEEKYGAFGGIYSFLEVNLSSSRNQIAFLAKMGVKDTFSIVTGEIDFNGKIVWQEEVTNFTESKMIEINKGYLIYGKNLSESNHIYFMDPYKKSIIEYNINSVLGNVISIKSICHLYGNNYLIFYVKSDGMHYMEMNTYNNNYTIYPHVIDPINVFYATTNSEGYTILGINNSRIERVNLKTYNTEIVWSYNLPNSVNVNAKKDNDDNIYITNSTLDENNNYKSTIRSISFSGGILNWNRTLTATYGYNSKSNNFLINSNDIFIIGNETNKYKKENGFIHKYHKPNGNLLFTKTLGINSGLEHLCINDTSIYLLGYINHHLLEDEKDWFIPYNTQQGWFIKLNISDITND